MPQDVHDLRFKIKGNKADWGDYQVVSLLSIAGKMLAWVTLTWLCIDQQMDLSGLFIDLTKAFHKANEDCIIDNIGLNGQLMNDPESGDLHWKKS